MADHERDRSHIILERRYGEGFTIEGPDGIVVRVIALSARRVKLSVRLPRELRVDRTDAFGNIEPRKSDTMSHGGVGNVLPYDPKND